jgi:hypothetical protein
MQDKLDPMGTAAGAKSRKGPEGIQGSAESPGAAGLSGTDPTGAQPSTSYGGNSGAGLTQQAKETVSQAASQAGDKVASRLNGQKDRAAEGLGSVADALRQTSDQLRGQDQTLPVHQYISSAADQVERFSGYLRSTNTREMVQRLEQFAREQPAVFLGSAFMLGLLGARFLKSSGREISGSSGSLPRDQSLVPQAAHTGASPYPRAATGTQQSAASDYGAGSSGTTGEWTQER